MIFSPLIMIVIRPFCLICYLVLVQCIILDKFTYQKLLAGAVSVSCSVVLDLGNLLMQYKLPTFTLKYCDLPIIKCNF